MSTERSVPGDLFLGIDLGTSSVKVVTLDGTGTVVDSATVAYDVDAPRSGWAQTATTDWWDAVVEATRGLSAGSRDRCAGIGLSGQMHGVVLADDDARALRPAVLHADSRAVAELAVYRELGPVALRRLANPLSPGMTGPVLLWLQRHEPEVVARARWALQPKDWLRAQLTGTVAAEPSDASATLLYDAPGDRWDTVTTAALGLDASLLAPLLPSAATVAGRLAPGPARALGLPPGLPVAAGGGDTAVAALGSGLPRSGVTQLTVGTGGQVITPVPAAVVLAAASGGPGSSDRPRTHLYRDVEDGWYSMAAVLNAGLALDWARRTLGASWEEVYASAAAPAGPGAPLFVPHLTGERTPFLDPSLRASWTGVELAHTRTDLLRAALEGVALNLRVALDALPQGDPTGPLRVAGGGTRTEAWRQLLADVLQRPLHFVPTAGASSRGAAVLGAVAAGRTTVALARTAWGPAATEPLRPRTGTGTTDRLDRFRQVVAGLGPTWQDLP